MKRIIFIYIFAAQVLGYAALAQEPQQAVPATDSVSSTTVGVTTQANGGSNVDVTAKWEQANTNYQNGEYTAAIILYEELLGGPSHSPELYCNLGNAYFKVNNLGRAILNYNRALLLDPANEDTQHNLAVASARTVDKIEGVPQLFFKRWLDSLGHIMCSDGWAVSSLLFLALSLVGIATWLLSSRLSLRKGGFYGAIVAAGVAIVSLVYAQRGYLELTASSQAIIVNTAAPAKSAPDASGRDLFLLHEGTKVTLLDELSGWSQIRLEDGNKGWIQSSALERIVPVG